MDMKNFDTKYSEYKSMIDEYLLDFLPKIDDKSETIKDSMIYSLEAGGKRIRPILLLATTEMIDDKFSLSDCLPYALAIEYIHTYSLIHDDLPAMDNDDLRRGKPTNHKVFGEAMAILAGDSLLNSAFEAMIKETMVDFDNLEKMKRKLRATSVITSAAGCKGMLAGQVADVEAEGKRISKELMKYICMTKTGAMIEGAVLAGGYLAGANKEQIKDLSVYGQELGLAFQIRDDILDVLGDTEKIGKLVGSDEKNSKSTYVTVYGMETAKARLKETTNRAVTAVEKYGKKSEFLVALAKKLEIREV